MKNDIKTKSTDFLPPKPGADPTGQPADNSNPAPDTNLVPPPADSPSKPAGPPMPTSAHVIDLKSQTTSEPADTKTSQDFMVKNNPFLKGTDKTEEAKPAATTVAVKEAAVKKEDQMPEPPKPELAEAAAEPEKPAETEKPPSVDLTHPESEKDPLKDAMVNEASTTKSKKKLPTWLLVVIIVIAVIIIAIGTFTVLNILARPTGI